MTNTAIKDGVDAAPAVITDRFPISRLGSGLKDTISLSDVEALITPNTVVVVKSVDDFPPPTGGLITLDSNVIYHIDGIVDIGANSLVIPTTGAQISAPNGARDVAILSSSQTSYSMFVSPSGSYSGNVVFGDFSITVDGASSKVFDLDNDGNGNALDIVNLNFLNCTSLGDLSSYRQLLFSNIGFISISDGLTFNGSWSGGIAAVTSIAVNFPAATLFKEGISLSFGGSLRSDMNFINVDSASIFMDFQESNILSDEGLILSGFRTISDDAMPNLVGSNVKVRYSGCVGIRNTYVGGEYTISTSATTTISAVDTLVKMEGTTTYTDMQWFSNTTDNAFVYDSLQEIEVEVVGSLSFTGASNKTIGLQVRIWDDSSSAYANIGPRFVATIGAGGRAENLSFIARTVINQEDRIEIWVENQTDTTNITSELGGFVGISQRPN